jgi:hypothetical protein
MFLVPTELPKPATIGKAWLIKKMPVQQKTLMFGATISAYER